MSANWSMRCLNLRIDMTDLFSKFDPLIEQRRALLETGLPDPFNLVMEKVLSPTVTI